MSHPTVISKCHLSRACHAMDSAFATKHTTQNIIERRAERKRVVHLFLADALSSFHVNVKQSAWL